LMNSTHTDASSFWTKNNQRLSTLGAGLIQGIAIHDKLHPHRCLFLLD
jgi:hypothetical protein